MQIYTHAWFRFPVIFYLALQKRSVNWFIIFAFVHFKLQLQETTSDDEKLIGLSDTVMACRSKDDSFHSAPVTEEALSFLFRPFPHTPQLKAGVSFIDSKQIQFSQGLYIHTAIPFALAHSLQPAAVILNLSCNDMALQVLFWASIYWILVLCAF